VRVTQKQKVGWGGVRGGRKEGGRGGRGERVLARFT